MKTYIIHVSSAYEREKIIKEQIKDKKLDAIFINEGDKKDLTKTILQEYFTEEMKVVSGQTSCAYKHILAYQNIVNDVDNDIFLILEDDIRFYSNFDKINQVLDEIHEKKLSNFLVSIEESILKYIPKSKRKKGEMLYPENMSRTTAAYLIDREAAKHILDFIKKEKVNLPIDWFLNRCIDSKITNMYWSEPTLAIQGSLDGSISSLIDDKKTGRFRILNFKIQKMYKKILYNFR